MSEYIYDASWERERERLAALELNLDPGTIRALEATGVASGWRCLEVGGGGGSITRWLCERVQPAGSVVATDLDPRFLQQIESPVLEVKRHDVVREEIADGPFDLIHTRDVLEHIPEREQVLDKLVDALRPGGWLVVEDVDIAVDLTGNDEAFGARLEHRDLLGRFWRAGAELMPKAGIDPEYGRKLPSALVDRGLVDVRAEVRSQLIHGGSPEAKMLELSLQHLSPRLVEAGKFSDAEVNLLVRAVRDPASFLFGPIHIAAWGRRPA